jgi:hypothetical protein
MVRLKMSHSNIVFTLLIDEDDEQKCRCGRGIKDMCLSISYQLSLCSCDTDDGFIGFVRESSDCNDPNMITNHKHPDDSQLVCECGMCYKQGIGYDLRWVSDDTAILTLKE